MNKPADDDRIVPYYGGLPFRASAARANDHLHVGISPQAAFIIPAHALRGIRKSPDNVDVSPEGKNGMALACTNSKRTGIRCFAQSQCLRWHPHAHSGG
jgi:hypothetical protein